MCWGEENATLYDVESIVNDAIQEYRQNRLYNDISDYLRSNLKISVEKASNPDCPSLLVSLYLYEELLSQSYIELK